MPHIGVVNGIPNSRRLTTMKRTELTAGQHYLCSRYGDWAQHGWGIRVRVLTTAPYVDPEDEWSRSLSPKKVRHFTLPDGEVVERETTARPAKPGEQGGVLVQLLDPDSGNPTGTLKVFPLTSIRDTWDAARRRITEAVAARKAAEADRRTEEADREQARADLVARITALTPATPPDTLATTRSFTPANYITLPIATVETLLALAASTGTEDPS